jgi:hypothetical protein
MGKINSCKFFVRKPEGKDHLKSLGIDGRIILGSIFREIWWEGVGWIYLVQDRD